MDTGQPAGGILLKSARNEINASEASVLIALWLMRRRLGTVLLLREARSREYQYYLCREAGVYEPPSRNKAVLEKQATGVTNERSSSMPLT